MAMNQDMIAKKATEMQKTTSDKTMKDFIKAMEGEIAKALPSVITPERFTRMTLSALSVNPKLGECTPKSFLGAMMTAAQLGVEPNTALQQAWLIPYRNHGVMECQFQLGYKGLIDLAYRSGEVSIIQAHVVYENDEFEYELGMDPKLKHKPAASNRGKAIAYYAMFKTKDGGFGFEVMSKEDIDNTAKKHSKSGDAGPWKTHYDEMAKKSVLKRVLKYAPLKSDFVRSVMQDETIKDLPDIDKNDDIVTIDMFDEPDITDYQDADYVDLTTGEVIDVK